MIRLTEKLCPSCQEIFRAYHREKDAKRRSTPESRAKAIAQASKWRDANLAKYKAYQRDYQKKYYHEVVKQKRKEAREKT